MRAFGLHFIEVLYSGSPSNPFGKALTIDIFSSGFLSEFSIPRFGFFFVIWLVNCIALRTRMACIQHHRVLLTSLPTDRQERTRWFALALSQFLFCSTPNIAEPHSQTNKDRVSALTNEHSLFPATHF